MNMQLKNARTNLPALAPELSNPAANAWEPYPTPVQSSALIVAFDGAQVHLEVQPPLKLSMNLLSVLGAHLIALAILAEHKFHTNPKV
jgi:hypothetical protein